MSKFYLDDYIRGRREQQNLNHKKMLHLDSSYYEFRELCEDIKGYFQEMFQDDSEAMINYQKKAILGHEKEVNYYLQLIRDYLNENNKNDVPFPPWYDSLVKAIFHERWGFAGIYQWIGMKDSSSCKIIGNRIYFMIKGSQQLQVQSISNERLGQLKKALLLGTPEMRQNAPYHEVYMADGTRIEIFNEAKETAIVFRKYVVNTYSFEKQAELRTIDPDMIPLLEAMVKCGFNVAFTGPVRTGKTTFLTTYQSYENPALEGVMVETDPEIPLNVIMPTAPIIQLIADDGDLETVIKPMMRADGDYLIMAEARDGYSLHVAVEITKKGTRRVKVSYHTGNPTNFCFDVAQMISKQVGGDVWSNMIQVAEGFQYVFSFQQMPYDKSVKKLKGIYEIRFDPETLLITSHQIVKYNQAGDYWEYQLDIGERVEEIGLEEDPQAFRLFREELEKLSKAQPMRGNHIKVSPYSRLMTKGMGVQ